MSKLRPCGIFTLFSLNSLFLISKSCVKHPNTVKLSALFSSDFIHPVTMENTFQCKSQFLAPPLTSNKHKGQAGRIGIFGGSLEYTGAPYFAAISALRVGADLVHVFCTKDAATVIKSYSPELIVHPLLNDENATEKIVPWLERLHVVLIGPGLGREPATFKVIEEIIRICRDLRKPLVIDADGLFLVSQKLEIVKDYPHPGVILTPNAMEFNRLMNAVPSEATTTNSIAALNLGKGVTVLRKGPEDEVLNADKNFSIGGGGSGRRCGGQGDLLSGALSTFYAWALQKDEGPLDDKAFTACYAASVLTRECNARAFEKKGRGMVCSDMIEEIPFVFRDLFEVR